VDDNSCGHRCCTITTNDYHRHLLPPDVCPRCAQVVHPSHCGEPDHVPPSDVLGSGSVMAEFGWWAFGLRSTR
jgi:hypothetical protein